LIRRPCSWDTSYPFHRVRSLAITVQVTSTGGRCSPTGHRPSAYPGRAVLIRPSRYMAPSSPFACAARTPFAPAPEAEALRPTVTRSRRLRAVVRQGPYRWPPTGRPHHYLEHFASQPKSTPPLSICRRHVNACSASSSPPGTAWCPCNGGKGRGLLARSHPLGSGPPSSFPVRAGRFTGRRGGGEAGENHRDPPRLPASL
jgi:hypothetical protein